MRVLLAVWLVSAKANMLTFQQRPVLAEPFAHVLHRAQVASRNFVQITVSSSVDAWPE